MTSSPMQRITNLRKRGAFVAAREGSRQHTTSLVLQALRRPVTGDTDSQEKACPITMRVGFTVTKKVGNAVIRNRVKRRLRAAAEICLSQQGKHNHDYVLIGKRSALHAPFDNIVTELSSALKRIHRPNHTSSKHAGHQNG